MQYEYILLIFGLLINKIVKLISLLGLGVSQKCSTRVQDLDSSPTRVTFFWDLDLRRQDLDLTRPADIDLCVL